MSDSQVIARKFRPQAFDQVVGQDAITRTLRNAIKSGRLHHAYLFTGARGVGKTTTARILAKALNCVQGVTTEPCGKCASCLEIAASSSLDVHEIDAASHTGIDNVREVIISTVQISPARDRYKIFIIDEVHQLSPSAFNALLKTLEEPPSHIVFILATTELHKVPDTILSRCQIFEFRTINTRNIFEQLRHIATTLGVEISDRALLAISRSGEGSMRDAESALDQVISFAGNSVADDDVSAALGLVDIETLAKTMHAIAEQDAQRVFRLVDEVVSRGYDLRNLCKEWMVYVRALLVVKAIGFDQELVQMPAEEGESLVRVSESFSEQDLVRFFAILVKTEQDIKVSSQPRFHLEIGLMRLVHVSRLYLLEDALARLADLQSRIGASSATALKSVASRSELPSPGQRSGAGPGISSGAGSRPAPSAVPTRRPPPSQPSQRATPEPREGPMRPAVPVQSSSTRPRVSEEPPPILGEPPDFDSATSATSADATESQQASSAHQNTGGQAAAEKILALLESRGKRMLISALDHADSIRVEGDFLCISYSPSGTLLKNQLETRDNRKSLEEASREVLARPIVLSVSLGRQEPSSPAEAKKQEAVDATEQARKHPAVRSLMDAFHGEVTDVIKPE